MAISVFDLFKIGIGPSSSHTVGPMIAARKFMLSIEASNELGKVTRIQSEMYGSLGATGKAHGTPKAIILGLEGEQPDQVDATLITQRIEKIHAEGKINLLGKQMIDYDQETDLRHFRRKSLPFHPNGMMFTAFDEKGKRLTQKTYYSVGGGFVVDDSNEDGNYIAEDETAITYPYDTAAELLDHCKKESLKISDVMMENENAWRPENKTREELLHLWSVMEEVVNCGIANKGILPGGLNVERRSHKLHEKLTQKSKKEPNDPLTILDWVTLYALATNEENAAGGRVVTAPTNGAAGIIPAVLHYYMRFVPKADDDGAVRFLLTAAAIGILYKKNASISGAEVGCQGEVGSACSMAAGALAEVLGGTPAQVENAAEIAMEHNLGLTCDPIGGLVQIPCIERNASASVKAIHAARMALQGDGTHFVSLDRVIQTMRKTGEDMNLRYKETSRGGLATNVLEVPVNIIEC
ncbi:MAG: L-serine ammonia-lyase [Gammaproteobacteria bacterium]|nr:L-serine ammonia-lyase [Gammaproteobacteria bacterium]|tara:strand:+ start:65783 stop:67183 length:1401 start_codon:yes stop_codon:yes gene_type:complete